MSDDWAKKAFERIQREKEEQRRNDELEMQKAARITGGSGLVYDDLVELIQKKAADLNEQFRLNVPRYSNNFQKYLQVMKRSNTLLEVVKEEPPHKRLLLEYEDTLPAIKYTILQYTRQNTEPGKESGKFLYAFSNGEVCLYIEGGGTIPLDGVATIMLDRVVS